MNFITKKHLSRRTFLRGAGVTVALPLLDSMLPAQTPLAKTAATPKSRFCGIYVPHGATMDKWTPAQEGAGFEFTESLKPVLKAILVSPNFLLRVERDKTKEGAYRVSDHELACQVLSSRDFVLLTESDLLT